ncbi:MAG: sulfatase-like hydrolase/transferase, partial [Bacteroidaceae bacterium]|nr:sulfatase-like hydrolase/transferase [Bacteroidaceae bacterium]
RILQDQRPVFMRIHLQAPGTRGYEISQSTPDKSYYRNIFGKDSPYVKAIENADILLGKFVSYLKKEKLLDSTVLVVTGDHGENKTGWHSLYNEECWRTPLLFVGADIAQGRKLPYFEQTDIAPTIAGLLGKDGPNHDGASGKFVKEILKNQEIFNYHPKMYLKKLDEQIRDFNFLRARLITLGKNDDSFINVAALLENSNFGEPFYNQDRILDWYKAGTTEHLLEVNQKVLDRVRNILSKKGGSMQ